MARRAFTLVELMIVVAIIGILASIAVPNFIEMQYKAKRQEVFVNMDGINTAQIAYEAAHDEFLTTDTNPGEPLTKKQRAWDQSLSNWDILGFHPDGHVRCNYKTTVYGGGDWFRTDGTCDIDDDNQTMIVRYRSALASTPGWDDLYPERY